MMTECEANRPSNGGFRIVVAIGAVLFAISLAMPLYGGGNDTTLFDVDSDGGVTLLVLFAVPLVVGLAGAARSPVMAGVAAGAALLLGAVSCFLWLGAVAAIVHFDAGDTGAGIAAMGLSSVLLVAGALTSMSHRRRAPRSLGASPTAVLGIIATIVTAVGVCIPPYGGDVGPWLGFQEDMQLFGVPTVVVLASLLFVGVVGFTGGRWGLGALIGYLGTAAVGIAIGESEVDDFSSESLVADVFRSMLDFHTAAVVGFWALVVLAVVHAIVVANAPSNEFLPAGAPAFGGGSSGAGARWADDPFGRHAQRYWDGSRWTEHVADGGAATVDPPVPSAPPGGGAAAPSAFAPAPSASGAPTAWSPAPADADPLAPFRPPADADAWGAINTDDEHTVARMTPPAPAPVTPAPVAPAPVVGVSGAAVLADRDGRTLSRAELEAIQRGGAAAPPTPTHTIVFDDGARVPLMSVLVIGRDPSAAKAPAGATIHRVDDPTMSVSKTHLAVGIAGGQVWVEDLGSVNGTSIVTAGGFATDVAPGQRLPVADGTTIRFGDRSCEVAR